jgi:aryl-alcohol dehydrogenase
VQTLAAVSREGAAFPAIETVEIEGPRPGELLVRVVASGICHTDLTVHGRPGPRPIVLGHEGAGIVEEVGEGVTRHAPGDHVVLTPSFCGHCRACRQGLTPYCDEAMPRSFGGSRMDGTTGVSQNGSPIHAHFFGQSSFSHLALADAKSAIKVAPDLPLDTLAPLACGIPTGAGSVFATFRLRPGQSIAVFGTGSVGLSAVMAARLSGAARIIAVDLVPSRLELASELGATDTIDASAGDAAERVLELTAGAGVDAALNTTAATPVYEQSVRCLGLRGVAGFVTPPREPWSPDVLHLMTGGRSIAGIIGGGMAASVLVPMLIEFHRQGRFPFDRLITRYPFERIADAFRDSERGETVKPLLMMGA